MTDSPPPPRGLVEVALLGRSHGLEGAVRVHPRDDASLAALRATPVAWIDGLGEVRVLELKPHGSAWLLRTDRIRRVEVAKELVHAAVRLDPRTLPDELAATLRWDPAGLPVFVDGRRWGEVTALEGASANAVLRVRGPAGERLLPLAASYVTLLDDAVRVDDPPPGLLDEA